MEKITAYKPKCCNRSYMSKQSAIRHERNCPKNPESRACQTCKHQSEERETIYNPYHGGDPGSTDYDVKYWWCAHFEKGIDKYAGFLENPNKYMEPRMHCEFWEGKESGAIPNEM